jgi:hypothetical protein
MVALIEQNVRSVREHLDGLGAERLQQVDPSATSASGSRAVQLEQAIVLALALWNVARTSPLPTGARDRLRLRWQFEILFSKAIDLIDDVRRLGLHVPSAALVPAALREVRADVLAPSAVAFARRDPLGRSAKQFEELLLDRVRFSLGRPVISEELAAELQLPCPFDPEPAEAIA